MNSVVVVDTSFLSDLSRRMVWTFPVVRVYGDVGEPPILVPDGVPEEYHRLLQELDNFGVPKASPAFEMQLRELQSANVQGRLYPYDISKENLLRDIFAMWQSLSPKAGKSLNYSIVDERIMETVVSNARQGTNVFVASADSDITATLDGYRQSGLPITVWQPQKLTRDVMEDTNIDLLVTGEVLQKLPDIVGSEAYKYFLKVARIHFEGDYVTDVAVDVERVDFLKKPNQYSDIRWIRVVKGGKVDPEAELRRLRTGSRYADAGQFALFYAQRPGLFRLYEKLPFDGSNKSYEFFKKSVAKGLERRLGDEPEDMRRTSMEALFGQVYSERTSPLESQLRDPDMRISFEAKRWARIDPDFLSRYSPHTLYTIRELRSHYPII